MIKIINKILRRWGYIPIKEQQKITTITTNEMPIIISERIIPMTQLLYGKEAIIKRTEEQMKYEILRGLQHYIISTKYENIDPPGIKIRLKLRIN